MFIKAGDSEISRGLAQKNQQESPGSLGSQRNGGLEDRLRGLAWDKLLLPICLLVASLVVSLRVQEMCACGGRRRGKEMAWAAAQRKSTLGLGPLGFYRSLQAGIFGKVSGESFSRIFNSSPGELFQVMVSTDWSVPGQGVISSYSWSWYYPPGFAAFLCLELKYS